MKNTECWGDKVFLVLLMSAFLLFCKRGLFAIYILWTIYLASGWQVVRNNPSDSNTNEFAGQLILGIVVSVIATVITILVHS